MAIHRLKCRCFTLQTNPSAKHRCRPLAPIMPPATRSVWPLKKWQPGVSAKCGVDWPFGCFLKWWYPQIIHLNRIFHWKPSIWGLSLFQETTISIRNIMKRGELVTFATSVDPTACRYHWMQGKIQWWFKVLHRSTKSWRSKARILVFVPGSKLKFAVQEPVKIRSISHFWHERWHRTLPIASNLGATLSSPGEVLL